MFSPTKPLILFDSLFHPLFLAPPSNEKHLMNDFPGQPTSCGIGTGNVLQYLLLFPWEISQDKMSFVRTLDLCGEAKAKVHTHPTLSGAIFMSAAHPAGSPMVPGSNPSGTLLKVHRGIDNFWLWKAAKIGSSGGFSRWNSDLSRVSRVWSLRPGWWNVVK